MELGQDGQAVWLKGRGVVRSQRRAAVQTTADLLRASSRRQE